MPPGIVPRNRSFGVAVRPNKMDSCGPAELPFGPHSVCSLTFGSVRCSFLACLDLAACVGWPVAALDECAEVAERSTGG